MAGLFYLPSVVLSPVNVPPGDPPDPPTATSPTGRDPIFMWSAEQQSVWQTMKDNQHWFWNRILANANKTMAGTPSSDDRGEWCVFVYQVTGDTAYAAKGWQFVEATINVALNSVGANNARENFAMMVVMVDWLWAYLDSTQKANAITYLERWANYCIANGTNANVGGFRTTDTDALHGYYAGLAALHHFNVPENTNYLNWLNKTDRNTGKVVGALAAPGTGTIRDAMAVYHATNIPGGVWVESSEYNSGTALLAMMLYGIARSASGATDNFPDLADFFEQYCNMAWHELTPDVQDNVQWGDDERPRSLYYRAYTRWRAVAAFAGLCDRFGLDSASAQQGLATADLLYSTWGSGFTNYHWRAFFYYNPYATVGTLPTTQSAHWAPGMGQQFVKDANSLAWLYAPNRPLCDHEVRHGATFQVYRDGEWVMRMPIAYAQPETSWDPRGTNGIELGGLPGHMSSRGLVRQESGSDWWAVTYQTSGAYYDLPFYDPPPSFVTKAERRMVYFKENGFDVVVVWDDTDAVDPRTLPKLDRYRTSWPYEAQSIAAQEAVKLLTFHMGTAPSIAGQVTTWVTPGGTTVKCHTLLPSAATITSVDESVFWSGVGSIQASEKKYHITVKETTEQQQTVFLHVLIAGNGTQPTISGASASGVTIGSRTVTFGASSTTVS